MANELLGQPAQVKFDSEQSRPQEVQSQAIQPQETQPVVSAARNAHPVKTERHDTLLRVHHTNTGDRPVDLYREHASGLYVSRRFVAHPRIAYWQAHLLPGLLGGPDTEGRTEGLGVQVCRYDFHGERAHDYYLDVATITRQGEVWTVRDHYLDLLVWDGLCAEIADTEELNAALAAGYIGQEEFASAVAAAHGVLNGLARTGYDLKLWLAGQGIELEWDGVGDAEEELALS